MACCKELKRRGVLTGAKKKEKVERGKRWERREEKTH